MSNCKFKKLQELVSYDGGNTWFPTSFYTKGEIIEYDSEDCTYQYRTTSGTPYCTGYDKYVDVYNQVSYDGGSTWETTSTTVTLVEHNSEDCGYVPPTPIYRWVQTTSTICIENVDYSSQYLTFVAQESGTFTFTPISSNTISYSLNSGSTWIQGNSVSVSANDKVLWKGTMTPFIIVLTFKSVLLIYTCVQACFPYVQMFSDLFKWSLCVAPVGKYS